MSFLHCKNYKLSEGLYFVARIFTLARAYFFMKMLLLLLNSSSFTSKTYYTTQKLSLCESAVD